MSRDRFHIGRTDGRSNQQVLLDYVKGGTAGQTYTYEEFAAALNEGADHDFTRRQVQQIVITIGTRLLKEQQHALQNIANVGYRLAHANEHSAMAIVRKRKADVQMKRGLHLLKHVQWDELSPIQRQLHEGMLLIVGGLYEQQSAFDRRLRKVESALKAIKN